MKKIALALVITTASLMSVVGTAHADGYVSQELDHCDRGSYGEITNCYYKNRKIHYPVDTAIDTQTAALIMAAAFIGMTASVTLTKLK